MSFRKYLTVDENHPINPINVYGYIKLAIENLLKWYIQLKRICFGALRHYNALGYNIKGRIRKESSKPITRSNGNCSGFT